MGLTEASDLGTEQVAHANVHKPIFFDDPGALGALASSRCASNHDFQVAIGCHNVDRAHTSDASTWGLLQVLEAAMGGNNAGCCTLWCPGGGGGCTQAGTGGGCSHSWPAGDVSMCLDGCHGYWSNTTMLVGCWAGDKITRFTNLSHVSIPETLYIPIAHCNSVRSTSKPISTIPQVSLDRPTHHSQDQCPLSAPQWAVVACSLRASAHQVLMFVHKT